MRQFLKSHWLLLGLLLIALFFRFWQISTLPGGLFPDEAANGLDVNAILKGDLQPFYERGNGREALFFYVLALLVAIFGRGPWQHHIVSAGFGFIEVLVTYFLTKQLFGKNVAYLAAFFMATSSFALTLSRSAFRANLVPLFTTLTLLLLVKFFQTKDKKSKLRLALLSGVVTALGFYTYISYRIMVPLLLGLLLILLIANRGKLKKIWAFHSKYVLAFTGTFIVIFAPLGYYFLTHPGTFIGRAGQVSIFSKDLNQGDVIGTLATVFKKTLLSFFTQGDLNWRHNISGFPFLSPLLSPFFAVSLVIFTLALLFLLKAAWRKKLNLEVFHMSLVALWFWLMLLPELMTAEAIPHGLRLVGVIPPMFILAAWSVNQFWMRLKAGSLWAKRSKIAYAVIFLTSLFVYNFYLYFGVAASSPEYAYAFRSDLTLVSNYLNNRGQKTKTFLALDKFSVQTVDYLTTEKQQPYRLLDPARTFEVKLQTGDQVIFTQSTLFDRIKFTQHHAEARLVKVEKNKFGEIIMLVYEQR